MDKTRLLYENSLRKEQEQRQNPKFNHDYLLIDKMLREINAFGYNFSYATDLTYYTINDERITPIIKRYLPGFDNIGFSLSLLPHISYLGKDNNAKFIVDFYYQLKAKGKIKQVAIDSIDNALCKIQDKTLIEDYITLISYPEHTDEFYLLMDLLGKWKIQQAIPHIVNRLQYDNLKASAINAISNYSNPTYIELVVPFTNSKNAHLRKVALKAISKMENN